MKTVFSKPGADVKNETEVLIRDNSERLARQIEVSRELKTSPLRNACPVCGLDPAGSDPFDHRGLAYVLCPECGHIFSRNQPPQGYPHIGTGAITYDRIYPSLSPGEYASRRDRIYTPKLEFVLDCLAEEGRDRAKVLGSRWCELGSGYGFFLDALKQAGGISLRGLEANPELVRRAGEVLGPDKVEPFQGLLSRAVKDTEADVYAAWFVIEHIEDTRAFFQALAAKPAGTVLAWAVPCFSLTSALETAGQSFMARQWDNGVHTQIFTEQSINHCLETAGMDLIGQWFFGQDAADLWRFLKVELEGNLPPELMVALEDNLTPALDAVQAAVDLAHLSDSRHMVAIKR